MIVALQPAVTGTQGNERISGELIVSRYIPEVMTTDAGRFGHIGLCQLRTKLKKLVSHCSIFSSHSRLQCYIT